MFDDDDEAWPAERARARRLMGEEGWRAARRTTLNAHYTDAAIATEMWRAVRGLGFERGRVLEPGCGAGTFLGLALPAAELTGVELDPTTARIATHLHGARARIESIAFERWEPDGPSGGRRALHP